MVDHVSSVFQGVTFDKGQLKTEPSSVKPTNLASPSIFDFTERVTTQKEQKIPKTFTTGQPAITDTNAITNASNRPSVTLLQHKKTAVGSAVASHGTERRGKMPLTLYGAVVGGAVVVLSVVALTAVCYKTQRRRRLRKGSLKVKSGPDSEAFEMKPVHTRNSCPARTISVRRLRSHDSTEDLLDISGREKERVALDANENQSFPSINFQDHHSAHVNPAALIDEHGDSPSRQTTRTFQDQIRVLIENELDELVYDSGIEEESSKSLRRSPSQFGLEPDRGSSECIPDRTLSLNETSLVQEGEPFYHVLEGPGTECSTLRDTGNENERVKSASIYQPLRINHQNSPQQGILVDDTDTEDETILSSSGIYQPLTPSKQVMLDDESKVSSQGGLDEIIDHETKASGSPKAMYQPLLDRHKARLLSNTDRPRSVTRIYHPLTASPESEGCPKRRCTAPQDTLLQVLPQTPKSEIRQGETDPIDQTVADEQRCPLNMDEPSSVSPRSPRHSPRPSSQEQRRTIHEPTYVTVNVRPSRQNRRLCNSEHDPRYTPPPCRKNPFPIHPSVSNAPVGHQRISSDGGRALSAILHHVNADNSSPPGGRRPLSVLPRHLGHRRNKSDIGLCPVDQRQKHTSRQLTSGSGGGIPRTSSMGSLVTEDQRSASDTTHCRVHIGP
ncbi:hypothetical protein AWC38_SpisGene6636 [Stylophora pistillata]|uniref:Uncharacterized protein n=1 Tax=Stylophora pistillata TaxID=50429 RepID=A0A2B4SJ74_STYPI|nr:hypothetical protein AWC38_SpisGene6636 [Stylophora pistillata]